MDTTDEVSGTSVPRESFLATNETTPLHHDKYEDDGLKLIITTFTVISAIITVGLGSSIYYGNREIQPHGSVVSDSPICTLVGEKILRDGGNAIDAAIAVTFCLGVVLPHLTGIGGNGLLLIYDQRSEKPVQCINSWPTPSSSSTLKNSVTLPGLLGILYVAHSNHGRLQWSKLVDPAIKTAKGGFPVPKSLGQSLNHVLKPNVSQSLKEWLLSLKIGTPIKSRQLAKSLEVIVQEREDALYRGTLSTGLLKYFSSKALSQFKPKSPSCAEIIKNGFKFVSSGDGSGGPFMLEILSNPNVTQDTTLADLINLVDLNIDHPEMFWGFPSGVTVSVTDGDDLYATIVSGLGPVLGSQILTEDGYILGSTLSPPGSISTVSSALVATEIGTRCGKRIITGAVDVRDLLQTLPCLVLSSQEPESCIESARARFGAEVLLAELDHAPSLGMGLPAATRPYPAINVIAKMGDEETPYADSRGNGLALHF